MFALGFPLLLVPFAIYNMVAFTPGVSWTSPVTTVHMMSGQDWVLTWEDILLAFAIFLLWIELTGDGAVHRQSCRCRRPQR